MYVPPSAIPLPEATICGAPSIAAGLSAIAAFCVRAGVPSIVVAVSIWAGSVRVEGERRDVPGDGRKEPTVQQYLLTVYQPDGDPPPPEFLEPIVRNLEVFHRELKAAGAWVFAGGLHPPSTATVVQQRGADVITTDGPYVEGKEHVGGICIIQAPDLDAALAWGRKATMATTLPIEVRPFQGDGDG
jgi:hypothetical protein